MWQDSFVAFFSPFSFCFFDRSKFDTIPISFCRHWRLKHARIFRILVIQMPFIMLTITRELTCHQCEHRMYYWPVTTLDCFVSSYKKQKKKRERETERMNGRVSKRKIVNHLFSRAVLFEYDKKNPLVRLFFFRRSFFLFLLLLFWHVRTINACHDGRVVYSSVFCMFCFIIIVSATRN